MKKPKGLSYSSMISYQNCPLQFKLEKILELPETKTLKVNDPGFRGDIAHNVIKDFFKESSVNMCDFVKPVEDSFDALLGKCYQKYEQYDCDRTYAKMIENFYRWIIERYYELESEFLLDDFCPIWDDSSGYLGTSINGVWFGGMVDAVFHNKGRLLIVDWKSNKKTKVEEYQINQAVAYYLLCQKKFKIEGDFYFMFLREKLDWNRGKVEITPKRIEEFETRLAETWKKIQEVIFPKQKDFRQCGWCRQNLNCQKFDEIGNLRPGFQI